VQRRRLVARMGSIGTVVHDLIKLAPDVVVSVECGEEGVISRWWILGTAIGRKRSDTVPLEVPVGGIAKSLDRSVQGRAGVVLLRRSPLDLFVSYRFSVFGCVKTIVGLRDFCVRRGLAGGAGISEVPFAGNELRTVGYGSVIRPHVLLGSARTLLDSFRAHF